MWPNEEDPLWTMPKTGPFPFLARSSSSQNTAVKSRTFCEKQDSWQPCLSVLSIFVRTKDVTIGAFRPPRGNARSDRCARREQSESCLTYEKCWPTNSVERYIIFQVNDNEITMQQSDSRVSSCWDQTRWNVEITNWRRRLNPILARRVGSRLSLLKVARQTIPVFLASSWRHRYTWRCGQRGLLPIVLFTRADC